MRVQIEKAYLYDTQLFSTIYLTYLNIVNYVAFALTFAYRLNKFRKIWIINFFL